MFKSFCHDCKQIKMPYFFIEITFPGLELEHWLAPGQLMLGSQLAPAGFFIIIIIIINLPQGVLLFIYHDHHQRDDHDHHDHLQLDHNDHYKHKVIGTGDPGQLLP